jgi:hypothetical protein
MTGHVSACGGLLHSQILSLEVVLFKGGRSPLTCPHE